MNINHLKKAFFCSAVAFATAALAEPSREDVREYECDYPEEGELDFLQDSDQWRGTVWLKCIDHNVDWDWQGTNLDHYGNELSTIRLTDCESSLYYDSEYTSINVAVELKDDEDSQKPAFYARDLRQGTYYFEKIKGDGTLKARTTDPWSSAAIVIKNYDEFAGSIETECAVVFGDVEDPERSGTGRIEIPEDETVTIAEGKHFSTQELKIDGTLIVNGALANVGMVYGSGTVVLPAEIEDGTDIGVYGCDESTIRFSDDFTGYFSKGCWIRGNLDLGGNTITLKGGNINEPYTINRLVGQGVIDIVGTAQPIKITEVLDMDTWEIAYQGRIIGDTSKVTLPEDFTLDSRGYIVRVGSDDYHYVTVPKMESLFTLTATNKSTGEALTDLKESEEYYVYRVGDRDVISVQFTASSNITMTSGDTYESSVAEDIVIPLPTASAPGLTVDEEGVASFTTASSVTPNKTYHFKRSQDLTVPIADWDTLKTQKAFTGVLWFVDPNPPERQAFYTVVAEED